MVCHKAKMKDTARRYASELMKPENRTLLDDKRRKKFENLIRKTAPSKDPEYISPCPFCKNPVLDIDDVCNNCKNTIPFDIISGCHLIPDDICLCPNCGFPAIMKLFIDYIKNGNPCPMCDNEIKLNDITICKDINATLKALTNVIPQIEDNEDKEEEDIKKSPINESIKRGPLL